MTVSKKFPKRDNGSPSGSRPVTQDCLTFDELKKLFEDFEAVNRTLSADSPDQIVYVVHYVTGSPMAALMISPTKAGDD
jgi:hypothetical protein